LRSNVHSGAAVNRQPLAAFCVVGTKRQILTARFAHAQEASMYRDFSNDISTDEDRLTFRKWVRGLAVFYGLMGLLFVSFVAVRNYQTDA
jgi:hypothetical protein